jgi:hypothetical protein
LARADYIIQQVCIYINICLGKLSEYTRFVAPRATMQAASVDAIPYTPILPEGNCAGCTTSPATQASFGKDLCQNFLILVQHCWQLYRPKGSRVSRVTAIEGFKWAA